MRVESFNSCDLPGYEFSQGGGILILLRFDFNRSQVLAVKTQLSSRLRNTKKYFYLNSSYIQVANYICPVILFNTLNPGTAKSVGVNFPP